MFKMEDFYEALPSNLREKVDELLSSLRQKLEENEVDLDDFLNDFGEIVSWFNSELNNITNSSKQEVNKTVAAINLMLSTITGSALQGASWLESILGFTCRLTFLFKTNPAEQRDILFFAPILNLILSFIKNLSEQNVVDKETLASGLSKLVSFTALLEYFNKQKLADNEKITYETIETVDKCIKKLKEISDMSYEDFESLCNHELEQYESVENQRFKEVLKYSFKQEENSKDDKSEKNYKLGPTIKERFLLFVYGFLSVFIIGIPFYRKLKNNIKARNRMVKTDAKLDLYYGKTKFDELSGGIKDRKSIKNFVEEINNHKSSEPALNGESKEAQI